MDVYTVSFWQTSIFGSDLLYALIDPEDLSILYIITKHGYFEADGTFSQP